MGIFLKRRLEQKNRKNYLVLSPSWGSKFHPVFPSILVSFVIFRNFYNNLFAGKFLLVFWIFSGLFALWITVMAIEYFPITLARFKRKQIIVKGGFTVYNKKTPLERWVEQ